MRRMKLRVNRSQLLSLSREQTSGSFQKEGTLQVGRKETGIILFYSGFTVVTSSFLFLSRLFCCLFLFAYFCLPKLCFLISSFLCPPHLSPVNYSRQNIFREKMHLMERGLKDVLIGKWDCFCVFSLLLLGLLCPLFGPRNLFPSHDSLCLHFLEYLCSQQ